LAGCQTGNIEDAGIIKTVKIEKSVYAFPFCSYVVPCLLWLEKLCTPGGSMSRE